VLVGLRSPLLLRLVDDPVVAIHGLPMVNLAREEDVVGHVGTEGVALPVFVVVLTRETEWVLDASEDVACPLDLKRWGEGSGN
jgi:hypothetical protein